MNRQWRSKICFKKMKQSSKLISTSALDLVIETNWCHRRNRTSPESEPKLDLFFCLHENRKNRIVRYRTSVHTRTERYNIVSFHFLVHVSVPPNFWTCFGTDRLISFRTRVNATPLCRRLYHFLEQNEIEQYDTTPV